MSKSQTNKSSQDLKTLFEFAPFGSHIPGRTLSGSEGYRYGFQNQEKDDEINEIVGAHITTLFRELDTRILRWLSHDPKPSASLTPYSSMNGNPIWLNDVLGDTTQFKNKAGKVVKTVDDNSNAIFQLTGDDRSDQYFKFTGYDKAQGGEDNVNIQTVIDFTQDYTRENYKSTPIYKKDKRGKIIKNSKGIPEIQRWQTYCNYGTRCIGTSVASGLEPIGINKADTKKV